MDNRYPQNQYWKTSHYQSEHTSIFIIKSNLCLTHQRCLLRRNEHFWIWCVLMRILQKNLNRWGKRRHYPLRLLSSGGFQICSVSSENRIAQVTLKRNEKINNCMSCGYLDHPSCADSLRNLSLCNFFVCRMHDVVPNPREAGVTRWRPGIAFLCFSSNIQMPTKIPET